MASRLKQIPESLLAKLWRERASREESLRAGNGRRFKVIYCGRPGTGPGPDFLEAVLEEEGVGLVRGDVELHVRQRDWEGHGHSTDPHYNGVILHVVAGMNGAYTTLQNGRQVPVLSLGPLLEDALPSPHPPRDLWPLLEAHGYSPPASPAEMGLLLDRAGDSWFLGERDGFLALMKEEDPEQVLYASLMEALGYSQNRGPFQELSHRVPYGLIRRAAMGASGGQRLRLIERLLLTTAGFLPASRRDKAMVLSSWRRFRVRPQNHPQRRIMGFARVLERFLNSPESDLTLRAARFRRGTLTAGSWPARVAKAIQSRPDGPRPSGASAVEEPCESWEGRGLLEGVTLLVRATSAPVGDAVCCRALENAFTATSRTSTGGRGPGEGPVEGTLIGEGRARDMAVNCVLPFVHAAAQQMGDNRLARQSMSLYHQLPRLQENEITREMGQILVAPQGSGEACGGRGRAGGSGEPWRRVVCNARMQQGLLHLHHLMVSPVTCTPGFPRRNWPREN